MELNNILENNLIIDEELIIYAKACNIEIEAREKEYMSVLLKSLELKNFYFDEIFKKKILYLIIIKLLLYFFEKYFY